jgi:hypothetical protein
MSKGLPYSMSRGNSASQLKTQTLRIDTTLTFTGAAGTPDPAQVAIAGLPQGNILFLGAVSYLTFDRNADTNLSATFEGDFALGTVPNADNDLGDANEADLVPSTAITAAVAGVTPQVRGVSTDALGGFIIDNTAGALEVNLNVILDDTMVTDTEVVVVLVTGVLHIAYIVLGDD